MELNKIYGENCLSTMDVMPDNFIDLTVTSPPYDKLRKYNGYSFDFENVARELYRVTKQGGVLVWVVSDATLKGSETGTSFRQALFLKDCGFNLHDTMIYRKKNFIPQTSKRYEQEFEYMFILCKGKIATFNPLMVPCKTAGTSKNFARAGYPRELKTDGSQRRRDEIITVKDIKIPGNIFSYAAVANRTGHPAPFPEKLAEDHILSWSNQGDLIYDPFTGSGTTLKMALINGRNFIGSEISPEYVKMAENRIFESMIN